MTFEDYKEANRLYWIVKGMLIPESWNEKSIIEMKRSYIGRIWHNHEATSVHEEGFEEACRFAGLENIFTTKYAA